MQVTELLKKGLRQYSSDFKKWIGFPDTHQAIGDSGREGNIFVYTAQEWRGQIFLIDTQQLKLSWHFPHAPWEWTIMEVHLISKILSLHNVFVSYDNELYLIRKKSYNSKHSFLKKILVILLISWDLCHNPSKQEQKIIQLGGSWRVQLFTSGAALRRAASSKPG